MLNPFFQQGSPSEQNLIQDLINEQLRMYGVEVYYMPREYVNERTIIREVIESQFSNAAPIEAYLENNEGYSDNTTLLSKFGIQSTQEINLIISQDRFEFYLEPLIKNTSNRKLSTRPKEGDLIYFPLGDRLFEIKFVEHEKPFYQLQKNYVYTLKCELFRYSDEVIDTGISEIDDNLVGNSLSGETEDGISSVLGGIQTLTLVGVASTATAITGIVDGGIRSITIGKQGAYFLTTPRVAISSAPSGGITGVGTAIMDRNSVNEIQLINAGAGYTIAPEIEFVSSTGVGASASSTIGDGVIGVVTVTSGGSGYTTTPTITFTNEVFLTGVTTVSAAGTAIVSAGGSITGIYITNSGVGYSIAPTISIPNNSVGLAGTFAFNEIVTGSVSGATARVRTFNSTTNILQIANVTGTFQVNETLTGGTSGATSPIRIINSDPIDDGFAENSLIESEADSILDFTERNPFGIP